MFRWITIGFGFAACLLALGGCEDRDPYRRTDVWKPTGANAANIAAMVADPRDLLQGRGATRSDIRSPELAVERVWTDQAKPFIGGSAGSSGGGGGGGSSSGSGGGSGGSGSSGSGSGGSGAGGTPGS